MFSAIVPLIFIVSVVHCYVNENYWTIVHDEIPPNPEIQLKFVRFGSHPRRNGRKSESTFPALLLSDGHLYFGQAIANESESAGGFCASFNTNGNVRETCDGFRIFSNYQTDGEFYLLRPEMFDPLLDDPVEFGPRRLVLIYDFHSDSSFFGMLQNDVVTAVDYDGTPVDVHGRTALSGEFLMYIARSRPFFNPYARYCQPPVYPFKQIDKTYIQWSVSIASMIATFPMFLACNQYGAKYVFLISGLISAVATALTPLCLSIGFEWLLFARVLQGKFGLRLICDSSLGWPWVHYFHGGFTLLLFALWAVFYYDDPVDSPFVSTREVAIIHKNKTEAHKHHSSFIPYRVLGFSSTETGVVGALGSLSHIPVKLFCGYISDTYHCIQERKKMWIFNSVALITPALIYIYLCYAPSEYPMVVVILFGAVHAGLGANCGGFYKCGALVSRQYAEFVIAFTQFIKCSVFFVAPALMAIFVQDDSVASQWHVIFWVTAIFLLVANVIFCIYATDEPQSFTFIERPSAKQPREQHSESML
ncbi:MFS domain-containing protein [Aphelenchoides besseyi]|nr:MFS domain-containing protein [Aphelenchoides besseyi]